LIKQEKLSVTDQIQ